MIEDKLTESEKKTKQTIYKIIGRKISESRKSSRRKLEGVSKKLNISVSLLKSIEEGEIEKIHQEIPINGFIRAFAKYTNTDIGEEIEKLQSSYNINQKPRGIHPQIPSIKVRNIFLVFLSSFCFLLIIIYFLNNDSNYDKENITDLKISIEEDYFKDEKFGKNNVEYFKPKIEEKISPQTIKENEKFFEIIFLEETWIEVYDDDRTLIKSGLFKIGDMLDFEFKTLESDVFIKSGNLGGFQIYFKDEFFAPFGYSGEVSKGFLLKEKIKKLKQKKVVNNEH